MNVWNLWEFFDSGSGSGCAWVCAELPCAATSQLQGKMFKTGVSSFDSERLDTSLNLTSNYRWIWCIYFGFQTRKARQRSDYESEASLLCSEKKCGVLSICHLIRSARSARSAARTFPCRPQKEAAAAAKVQRSVPFHQWYFVLAVFIYNWS